MTVVLKGIQITLKLRKNVRRCVRALMTLRRLQRRCPFAVRIPGKPTEFFEVYLKTIFDRPELVLVPTCTWFNAFNDASQGESR